MACSKTSVVGERKAPVPAVGDDCHDEDSWLQVCAALLDGRELQRGWRFISFYIAHHTDMPSLERKNAPFGFT